jgi:hypothetical protein
MTDNENILVYHGTELITAAKSYFYSAGPQGVNII